MVITHPVTFAAFMVVASMVLTKVAFNIGPPGHKHRKFVEAQCTLRHGTTVDHVCISNDAIVDGRACVVSMGITCLGEMDRNGVVYYGNFFHDKFFPR